jgi:hypothetical protein
MIVLVMSGIGTTLWVLEMLHQMDVWQGRAIFLIAVLSVGIIIYTYTVIMMGVKRYRMAYRAVQAFTDLRKPVVYLRAFHADDVVETQEKLTVLRSECYLRERECYLRQDDFINGSRALQIQ